MNSTAKRDEQRRYRDKIIERVCVQCGVLFHRRRGSNGKHCDTCGLAIRLKNLYHNEKMKITCRQCGKLFPSDRATKVLCSQACKTVEQSTGRKRKTVAIGKARSAQSLIAYHVKSGRISKPDTCEHCGRSGIAIEAAHEDYDQPLKVRWLCVSCHRRWDKQNPKHGTVSVILKRAEAEGLTVEKQVTV